MFVILLSFGAKIAGVNATERELHITGINFKPFQSRGVYVTAVSLLSRQLGPAPVLKYPQGRWGALKYNILTHNVSFSRGRRRQWSQHRSEACAKCKALRASKPRGDTRQIGVSRKEKFLETVGLALKKK